MFIKFFPSLFFSPSQIKSACSVIWPSFSWNNSHPKWSLTDVTFGPPPPPSDMLPVVLLIINLATGLSHGWRSHFGCFFSPSKKQTHSYLTQPPTLFIFQEVPFPASAMCVMATTVLVAGGKCEGVFLGNGPLGTLTNRWSESEINENSK